MENTKVELTAEEIEVLKKFHENKKRELLSQLHSIESRIKYYGINEKLDENQRAIPFSDGFPINGKLPEKTMYAFMQIGKPATIRQIYEKLAEFDPSVKSSDGSNDPEKYRQVYSAILNKVAKKDVYKVSDKPFATFAIRTINDFKIIE